LHFSAIPLSPSHPSEQIEYFLNDSKAAIIVGTSEFESKLRPVAEKLNKPLLLIDHQVQTANDHHEAEGILKVLANEVPCRSEDSALIM
jgi:long-subunit acyl-CoA synthetase (AMP-forming)